MATHNELIYSVLDKLKPHLTDDIDISPREIGWEIGVTRALLLRQELNKNRTIDAAIIQDLGCVEVEVSDRAECCDISTDCKIIRTKLEIPTAIELYNSTGITRIGPIDKLDMDYSFITYNRAKFVGNGKYNKDLIYAFLRNNRVYLVSKNDKVKFIKYINIAGVFENPTEVIPFTNCGGTSCFSSDDEYPINSWMIPVLQDMVINKFIRTIQMPKDTINDGTDTVLTQPSK